MVFYTNYRVIRLIEFQYDPWRSEKHFLLRAQDWVDGVLIIRLEKEFETLNEAIQFAEKLKFPCDEIVILENKKYFERCKILYRKTKTSPP